MTDMTAGLVGERLLPGLQNASLHLLISCVSPFHHDLSNDSPQIPSYISTSMHELNVKGIRVQPAEGWRDGSIDKALVPNMRI